MKIFVDVLSCLHSSFIFYSYLATRTILVTLQLPYSHHGCIKWHLRWLFKAFLCLGGFFMLGDLSKSCQNIHPWLGLEMITRYVFWLIILLSGFWNELLQGKGGKNGYPAMLCPKECFPFMDSLDYQVKNIKNVKW